MKRLGKIIKYIGLVTLLIFLFRGFLYRTLINYTKIGVRQNIVLSNKKLIDEIDKQTYNKAMNIEEIISLSNELTSKILSFTFTDVSSNPNRISVIRKANCIGYSSLYNSIGNFLISKQNMTNRYEFNHLIGELDILGYDIHNLFNSEFFKNHDYNEIYDKKTGKKIFVDPSLRDYFRIKNVSSE